MDAPPERCHRAARIRFMWLWSGTIIGSGIALHGSRGRSTPCLVNSVARSVLVRSSGLAICRAESCPLSMAIPITSVNGFENRVGGAALTAPCGLSGKAASGSACAIACFSLPNEINRHVRAEVVTHSSSPTEFMCAVTISSIGFYQSPNHSIAPGGMSAAVAGLPASGSTRSSPTPRASSERLGSIASQVRMTRSGSTFPMLSAMLGRSVEVEPGRAQAARDAAVGGGPLAAGWSAGGDPRPPTTVPPQAPTLGARP